MSSKWEKKIILLFCLVFFLIGGVNSLLAKEAVGKVDTLEGRVEIQPGKTKKWEALDVETKIYQKDTIKTGEDSRAKISFIDESIVSIGPEATIEIEKLIYTPAKNYRETALRLLIGKARFNVARLFSGNSKFEVYTPTAIAGVKGTNFVVDVISPDEVQVDVTEGQVDARIGNITTNLGEGSSVRVSVDRATGRVAVDCNRETVTITLGEMTFVVEEKEGIAINADGSVEVTSGEIIMYHEGRSQKLVKGAIIPTGVSPAIGREPLEPVVIESEPEEPELIEGTPYAP